MAQGKGKFVVFKNREATRAGMVVNKEGIREKCPRELGRARPC